MIKHKNSDYRTELELDLQNNMPKKLYQTNTIDICPYGEMSLNHSSIECELSYT